MNNIDVVCMLFVWTLLCNKAGTNFRMTHERADNRAFRLSSLMYALSEAERQRIAKEFGETPTVLCRLTEMLAIKLRSLGLPARQCKGWQAGLP